MTWSHNIGSSKAIALLLCIVILKKDVPRLGMLSSTGSSPNQNLNQWFFQNRNEPLIRLNDFGMSLRQEGSTSTQDM
jgi:hypothetical protein